MKSITKFGAVLATLVLLAVGSGRADEDLKTAAQTALNEVDALAGPSAAALQSANCARLFVTGGFNQTQARFILAKVNTNMGNDPDACALVEGYLTQAQLSINKATAEYTLADAANLAGYGQRVNANNLFNGGINGDYAGCILVCGQAKGNFSVSITQSNLCSADCVAAGDPLIAAMGIINQFYPGPPGGG